MLEGVSKTALLTLRARAEEHIRKDGFLDDPTAVEWLARVPWPPELDRWYSSPRVAQLAAFRAHEFDTVASRLLDPPGRTVVELGCGLSTRRERLSGAARWIDVDLSPIIELRREWGVTGEMMALDVRDEAWIDALDVPPADVLLIAEGLLYYVPRADVDAWFLRLRERLGGATILFDVLGDADFAAARDRSTALGTPILWKTDPPFERVFSDFGLDPIEGLDPTRLMHEAIDRYWGRFGAGVQYVVKTLARVPALAGKRSGLVAGRIRAP